MKVGKVYCCEAFAGTLTQDSEGFVFRYDDAYFANSSLPDVSATLPKTQIEYRSKVLFPFFFGLLAEGVQKERQCRELNTKLHQFLRNDRILSVAEQWKPTTTVLAGVSRFWYTPANDKL